MGHHAWIVGNYEKIVYSYDDGDSWTEQHNGSFALYDVFFVDRNNGWAVGKNGTILHTSTGGHGDSWDYQVSNTSFDIYGVWFLNADVGWVAGDNGLILKTEDGGNNWSPLNSGISPLLTDISFCDENNGVAIGLDGIILHTIDGGDIWHSETGIVNTMLRGIHYQSLENCWAVGENGEILYSIGSVSINAPTTGDLFEEGSKDTILYVESLGS